MLFYTRVALRLFSRRSKCLPLRGHTSPTPPDKRLFVSLRPGSSSSRGLCATHQHGEWPTLTALTAVLSWDCECENHQHR